MRTLLLFPYPTSKGQKAVVQAHDAHALMDLHTRSHTGLCDKCWKRWPCPVRHTAETRLALARKVLAVTGDTEMFPIHAARSHMTGPRGQADARTEPHRVEQFLIVRHWKDAPGSSRHTP